MLRTEEGCVSQIFEDNQQATAIPLSPAPRARLDASAAPLSDSQSLPALTPHPSYFLAVLTCSSGWDALHATQPVQ